MSIVLFTSLYMYVSLSKINQILVLLFITLHSLFSPVPTVVVCIHNGA